MIKDDERDVRRKLRVLEHARKTGHVAKTCRDFGIGRASFYRWKTLYAKAGETGLVNAKTIPKNPPNQTPQRKFCICGANTISDPSVSCGT